MRFFKRVKILTLGLLAVSIVNVKCTSKENQASASKGSDQLRLPADYEQKSAAEKSDILFKNVEETKYETLPPLKSVNVIKFVTSQLLNKMNLPIDEAPIGYEKSIHAHGVVAKIAFEAENNIYTGLFQGAPYGVIRLSVTSDPKGKDFAPGMALKLLVDGQPSRNLSALYKLSGQGEDHNFFAHELSNIIPVEIDPKSLFSSAIFRKVSSNPTKVAINPFAGVKADGQVALNAVSPVQIYFVPSPPLKFSSESHDFRNDLLGLPAETVLYDVYATQETGENFRKIDEARRAKAVRIGRIVSKSPFVASDFGDRRLFFRHFRFEDHNKD